MSPDDQKPSHAPLPDLSNLLIDRNQDGFPDDIVGMLAIPHEIDTSTWEAVVNLSARLGLGSSGFSPPIVDREPLLGRLSVTVRPGDGERLNALAMNGLSSGTSANPNPVATPVERIDLSDPWTIQGLLLDRDDDQAADDSAIHFSVPEHIPFEVGAALAELAARIGVECGALTLPVAGGSRPAWRTTFGIEINEENEATLTHQADGSLLFSGNPDALAHGIRQLAGLSAGFLPDRPAHRAIDWLRRSAVGWTVEGRTAQLRNALEHQRPDRIVLLEAESQARQRMETLVNQFAPGASEPPHQRETVVFDHQWSAEWEMNRLFQALEQDTLPLLSPGEPVNLVAMISEPPAIRRRIRGQISRWMLERGFSAGSLHVLDAFKPGLGWLQEIVLPDLRELDTISQIEIKARSWDPDQHDGQLDMPIRWLQELFPGDEILARELDLSLEQITIDLSENLESIYLVMAWNDEGEITLERSFSPLWRRIDYLAGFHDAGSVTVTTGGIIARQNDAVHRTRVLTDPEVFWRYMQGELLPGLRRFILTTTNSQPGLEDQPFFDDLFIDVRLSASDQPYDIRQERHSAAEALHEDIYFNVLDFVEELGLSITGEKLSAPGSIRPFVTVTPGRQPEARIRLTRRSAGITRILADSDVQMVYPATKTLPERPMISSLTFDGDRLIVQVDQSAQLEEVNGFLSALAAECPAFDASTVLRIHVGDENVEIGVPDYSTTEVSDGTAGTTIPDNTIISNEEIYPHLSRLAKYPAVTLIPAAEISWQGRPIPAVAVTSPQQARIWSMRKLSHFKPTKLIVARHHANEVASTTSALQMIEALSADSSGDAMLRGLNVVFLPLENPDGAALHDELRRTSPTWKHHPARYNATGYEFGEDQGNPDTRYGEGRVRDLVWHACLPDIVVDNHGVPSHEWAQLFAGFGSPPRFGVSYWQVQALLYGILPYLDEPEHRAAYEAVRERVASEIAADGELLHWNRIYTERYRTWGHRWVPERFPLELVNEMLFHINPVDPEGPRGKRSYALRYPRTTILNWVTEVCDETVEGEELERTARAHFLANKAVMELLREHAGRLGSDAELTSDGVYVRTGRERPLRMRSDENSPTISEHVNQ
jgi:hypothetical protein